MKSIDKLDDLRMRERDEEIDRLRECNARQAVIIKDLKAALSEKDKEEK